MIVFFRTYKYDNQKMWIPFYKIYFKISIKGRRGHRNKCFTCFTKTFANLTTYSRKPGDYNGTIIFEIDIMKNSSPLNLKFTLFAMSKPKQQFFSAGLTALSAQLRVNQNKRNNQNNCEKVKFDKDLNWLGMSFSWYQSQR